MIASTTNCCKSSATVAATVAAAVAAKVAATVTTAVARTVITFVQNGVNIFRKQSGVNVDPSGIGWV